MRRRSESFTLTSSLSFASHLPERPMPQGWYTRARAIRTACPAGGCGGLFLVVSGPQKKIPGGH